MGEYSRFERMQKRNANNNMITGFEAMETNGFAGIYR
jgi:hypothetical protein